MANQLKDTMQYARGQYEAIPVPQELSERLQSTLDTADDTKKKGRVLRFGTYFARALAAACLTIVVGVNVSAQVAQGLAKVPVLGAFAQLVTFRNYEDNRQNTEAEIQIPHVTGLNHAALEEALNKEFDAYGAELIARYEEDLKTLGTEGFESVLSEYRVVRETERQLTIELSTLVTQASGQQINRYYTVDKQKGTILSLKDLFVSGADYVTPISAQIIAQMQEKMKTEDAVYFIGEEEAEPFKTIGENQQFYINEQGNLVISFDEYEVALGFMGAVSFEIERDTIAPLIAPDSLILS